MARLDLASLASLAARSRSRSRSCSLCTLSVALGLAILGAAAPASAAPDLALDVRKHGLVYRVPGMDAAVVRRDVALPGAPKIDVYTPAAPRAGKLPVVVFANGMGDVPGSQLRSWQIYQDWARAVAARGYAAVLHVADGTRAQDDIASVLEGLRTGGAALGLDGDRVIVWASSGNVSAALPVLMERAPRGVRAAVIYYGAGPAKQLRKDLPVMWVLAGQENPQLIRGQRALWARAVEEGAPWTMVQAPTLPHAFDGLDTSEDSRRIVAATFAFFDAHLGALPAAPPPSEGRGILADLYGHRPLAAVPKLEALARAHPRNPEALATLAWAYRSAGKNRDAVAAYAKAFALEPSDLLVARHLATIASQVGDCRAAAPAFAALARTTLDAQLLTAQGTCDLLEGRAAAGRQRIDAAIAAGARASVTYYNVACGLALAGKRDDALTALEEAVARGWTDGAHMTSDSDLASLRDTARFRALVAKLAAAPKPAAPPKP